MDLNKNWPYENPQLERFGPIDEILDVLNSTCDEPEMFFNNYYKSKLKTPLKILWFLEFINI